jgi:hypothetical protein
MNLSDLHNADTNRIYIAGPMTGIPDHNFPLFNEVAAKLRAADWEVINPAEHGVVEGAVWADYLRYDIKKLMDCGAIYLLPGWEQSKGASLEVMIARRLGFKFYYHMDAKVLLGDEPLGYFAITDPLRPQYGYGPFHSETADRALRNLRTIVDACKPLDDLRHFIDHEEKAPMPYVGELPPLPEPDKAIVPGDIVRYREGPTALMQVTDIFNGVVYGDHCLGGSVGASLKNCRLATDGEIGTTVWALGVKS